MKSETRANLIFIIVLLCIVVPGATMLVRRTLRTGGRQFMPPPVKHQYAYLDASQWSDLPRVTPPGLGRFVTRLGSRLATMQPEMTSIVGEPTFTPVMSDKLGLQLVARGGGADAHHVGLVAWTSKLAPLPELFEVTARRGEADVRGSIAAHEMQNMPIELRRELQDYGYVLPPDGLMWFICTFPGNGPVDVVRVKYSLEGFTFDETLRTDATSRGGSSASTVPTGAP